MSRPAASLLLAFALSATAVLLPPAAAADCLPVEVSGPEDDLLSAAALGEACISVSSSPSGLPEPSFAASADACAMTRLPGDHERNLCVEASWEAVRLGPGAEPLNTYPYTGWQYDNGISSGGGTPCAGCVPVVGSITLSSFLTGPTYSETLPPQWICSHAYNQIPGWNIVVTCATSQGPQGGGQWRCLNTGVTATPVIANQVVTGRLGCQGGTLEATGNWPNSGTQKIGTATAGDLGQGYTVTCSAKSNLPNTMADWQVTCEF